MPQWLLLDHRRLVPGELVLRCEGVEDLLRILIAVRRLLQDKPAVAMPVEDGRDLIASGAPGHGGVQCWLFGHDVPPSRRPPDAMPEADVSTLPCSLRSGHAPFGGLQRG